MDTTVRRSSNVKQGRFSAKDIAYIGIFVAIMAICSWISIPATIPFTMQTFAVFVTIGLLGMYRGTVAVLVYILLGAVGAPVFAGFNGGIGALMGNAGGYIIGFLATALITGLLIKQFGRSTVTMFFAMVAGLFACYAFGTAWFIFFYTKTSGAIGIMSVLSWCVIPFIIPDLVKIVLAIIITKRVHAHGIL
ncbi:MAG: biotin transporter BioY [Lachnospiraceae bacterium]|nr:biotin transporter BioY [Lachnospiraceae bacterium]